MAHNDRGEVVVGLDIGTTKICVIVGEINDGHVDIIGIGTNPSEGLRRGVVVNIESTVDSICKAVEEAERMSGCEISAVFVGIAGSHIKGFNSKGLVPVRHHEIRKDDIDRVVEAARAVNIPTDQEIIHVLPQEFTVDDQEGIQYPMGMTGVRLEAEVHIVTGMVTAVQNIIKCCNRAGLVVSDVVLEQLASAEAVLTKEEMELGIALIDIGGGTSDLAVFTEGTIKHTFVLGLGGQNLTNDLSVGLRTPQKEAERLKEQFGGAFASLIDKNQAIEVPSVGGRKARKLSRKVMGEIIEPRIEEMLSLIKEELIDSGFRNMVNAGLVITGGTALLEHLDDMAEQIFDLPVRIGYPQNVGGITDIVSSPKFATGVGLVLYGMKHEPQRGFRSGAEGNVLERIAGRMKDWFRGAI
ncbi:MAG: cell division protein FtsA [Proteobacteria bacterium]|nr:cell division protein FtsA [Pseudomonadota bacterium]MBU1717328.1 cell division protein FtsA [Pseudomonadota bacterium]